MLSFTAKGAVGTPRTVQIRIGTEDAGALRAGVPRPSRALTDDEIVEQIRWFTSGRRGPRTVPCTELVLSGARGARHGLGRVVRQARELGIDRVVLHGDGPPDLLATVDAVAVRCEGPADVPRSPPHKVWTAHLPLVRQALPDLPTTIERLIALDPQRVVLSWPFPGPGVEVIPVQEALSVARSARDGAPRGAPVVIRGLPACLEPSASTPTSTRTRNRFYVDADHQGADALLFVPDVVQFLKPDSCRACACSPRCDGVPRAWLEAGVMGVLEPVRPAGDGPC